MNNRIKELAEQATEYNEQTLTGWLNPEKFAELIVRECGEIAYIKYWENPEGVRGIHIKDAILKNFGVE